MSHRGDAARLFKISKYISDIEIIVKRHGSPEDSLADMEGQYAIMLCIAQIGELLNKIRSPEWSNRLPVKYAVAFRNIVVHDYEGINMNLAIRTLKESIPALKIIILDLIKEYEITRPDNF